MVTVTDANGCTASFAGLVSEPNEIISAPTLTFSNCGQPNGEICVSASGGAGFGGFTYLWDDPSAQTSSCASGLFAGCHQVTITDAYYCNFVQTYCIGDIEGPYTNVVSSQDVDCFGAANGELTFNIVQSVAPYTYELTLQGTGVVGTGALSYSGLGGGCYNFIVTDAAGCIGAATECIDEPDEMFALASNIQDVSCFGLCDGSAEASALGGTLPYTYAWSGGSTPSASQTAGLCAGNFNLTITDANGCQVAVPFEIEQPDELAMTSTTSNNPCFGDCEGVIQLNVTGGTLPHIYSWTGNGANGSNASGLCAGAYTVQILDGNGCTTGGSYNITQPTALTLALDITQPVCAQCNGQSAAIVNGGTVPYTYSWFGSGNNPNGQINDGLCAGALNVLVTDANGCEITTGATLNDSPPPVINGIQVTDVLCHDGNTGSMLVDAVSISGAAIMAHIWDAAAGSQNGPQANNLAVGAYCVTVVDINGCSASACDIVGQPDALISTPVGADSICFGQSTIIFAGATGGTLPYNVTWAPATGLGNQAGG
jgi:hypothetical protein